jgi:hypothetical protein
MGESASRDVTVHRVEDAAPEDRAARLTALLATGIERWLKARAAVDFGRDVSVHPNGESERRTW